MAADSVIRIATRSSDLALYQANLVRSLLEARGHRAELVTFKTVGDKRLDEPLNAIGAKGLFTKELEASLHKGKVDCCVHSLKDLPTESPDGLVIGAVLPREDPRDVLVIADVVGAETLDELPRGSRVGTSSLRRRAQLAARRKDLDIVELRGNVPTRVKKVDTGVVHAAILAAAGLHRLGVSQRITAVLDAPAWLPAPGQGAIAIQIRENDAHLIALTAALNDARTMTDVRAERAFLGALEGGCQVPIGALVLPHSSGAFVLHGLIADLQGARVVRGEIALDERDPELSGVRLANQLRGQGATEILEELRRAQGLPSPQPE
ncbi:MAG: hydroxymethylbilane synthase [Gemmatimonadota bacterium]|nr:hydroxymethylbilane synthase [Gemmatimonadota bacterium]MDE3216636.1 hydroxymethylbilane synthase [Gemmatimonadota bacterium]